MAATTLKVIAEAQAVEDLITEGRMVITPELAQRIITERVYARQRPVESFHVALLADMIRRGEFKPGRQIWFGVVDSRLHLIDGQHRLCAVMAAGVGIEFDVQMLPLDSTADLHEAYITFDRVGRPRSLPEVLNALGISEQHKLGKLVAAGVFRAALLIHFNFEPPHHTVDPIAVRSDAERMRYAEPYWGVAHDYEKLIARAPSTVRRRLRAPQLIAVALITLTHQKEQATLFWGGVAENDGLRRGDPRHTLLRWLSDHLFDRVGYSGAGAAALAWNAFYEHRSIETLKTGAMTSIKIAGTPFKGGGR